MAEFKPPDDDDLSDHLGELQERLKARLRGAKSSGSQNPDAIATERDEPFYVDEEGVLSEDADVEERSITRPSVPRVPAHLLGKSPPATNQVTPALVVDRDLISAVDTVTAHVRGLLKVRKVSEVQGAERIERVLFVGLSFVLGFVGGLGGIVMGIALATWKLMPLVLELARDR